MHGFPAHLRSMRVPPRRSAGVRAEALMLSARRLLNRTAALLAGRCSQWSFGLYMFYGTAGTAAQRIAPAEGFDAVYRQIQRTRNPGIALSGGAQSDNLFSFMAVHGSFLQMAMETRSSTSLEKPRRK